MNLKGLITKYFGQSGQVVKGPGYELGHGWYGDFSTIKHYNSYENAYPSIRVIAHKFASIEPYVIDKSGISVESNVLDRLYTPNTAMSAYDFREALAVMSLVHNKVYLRVHHKGTRINAESITGFTFLEGVSEELAEGKVYYRLPNAERLTTAEVIVLKDINPYHLHDGFSHAYAARRWTTLDDLIADYQSGFFNNGAVPAGQFIITAKTATDFKDMRQAILDHHQGAGKNNNVMFSHRPVDQTGKPLDSQIEWQPFSVANKDMALKDLFEQANKKIDSVYGVPASLRGVNDSNTYASVRVDQQIFVENTLEPFTLKVWQKMTHELNRISGGLGVAITFDLETPVVADEEKVKAEAQQITATTITTLSQSFELDSIAAYLKSGDPADLIEKPKPVELAEVLDSDEAKDTPEQPADPSQPSSKAFQPEDQAKYQERVESVVRSALERQTETAARLLASKDVTDDSPVDEAEDERVTEELLTVLLAALSFQGAREHTANLALVLEAGIDTSGVGSFRLTGAQRAAYERLVGKVAASMNATTAEKIRNVIRVGRDQQLPADQIRRQLKGLVEDWRINQIAVTEVTRAGNEASLYSMQDIAKETGATIEKVWTHGGGDAPCEFCRNFIGTSVPLDQDFIGVGDTYTGLDGGIRTNDFAPVTGGGLHPACHCRPTYKVVTNALAEAA